MLEFVKNGFRKSMEFFLWLNLIACTIGGGLLFNFLTNTRNSWGGGYNTSPGFIILGIIIGFAVGIISNITVGGYIATILNMDKNLEILAGGNSSPSAIRKAITTVEVGSFTDSRDNKTYKTVKIGTQTWMAENLSYDAEGSKCYENNPANCQKYGRLYDWETAKKACPAGWHLPTKAEWDVLTASVGGEKTAGKYLKSVNGWNNGGNGEDAFGFAALPGGFSRLSGDFSNTGNMGRWWSASEYSSVNAYYRYMDYGSDFALWGYDGKSYLFSVRYLKDE